MVEVKEMEKPPDGWTRVRLGAVIIENPKSPFKVEDADNSGDYPFFTSGEQVLTHSKFLVDGENLFISTGGTTYTKYFNGKASYSADTYSVKTKGNTNTKLIYYILDKHTNHITFRFFIGSGLEHLQKDYFKSNFEILIPEKPTEQQKIAEILEAVDNAIEKTDKIIEKYKRIKQGLMQDLLTKGVDENGQIRSEETHKFKVSPLGRIPEEWKAISVYDSVNIISGGTPNTSIPEYWNGTIHWLSVEDFNTGKRWVFSSYKYITELGLKKSATSLLKKGMLIISARGTVGVIAQLGRDMAFNQTSYGLDSKDKSNLSNDFLYYALKYYINLFSSLAYGNVFDTITRDTFKEIYIPLPPLPEQQRIASTLSLIDETIEKEQKYKQKLERLKQGLMEDLLTGKVRVNHLIEEAENVYQT